MQGVPGGPRMGDELLMLHVSGRAMKTMQVPPKKKDIVRSVLKDPPDACPHDSTESSC